MSPRHASATARTTVLTSVLRGAAPMATIASTREATTAYVPTDQLDHVRATLRGFAFPFTECDHGNGRTTVTIPAAAFPA